MAVATFRSHDSNIAGPFASKAAAAGGGVDKKRSHSTAMSQGPDVQQPFTSQQPFPPPPTAAQAEVSPTTSSLKKRKLSKTKTPLELRRATSTPHIRGLAMTEGGPLSPSSADKRRNKLGYHRTSVACGHCRRRKIRCLLPSPEDPQGRCANCIRLKKECVFYPVNENSQHERPTKKPSIAGASSGGSSTSPRGNPPSNQGSVDDSQSKGSFPQPVRQLQSAAPADGFTAPHTNGAPFYPHPYPYQTLQSGETYSPAGYASPGAPHPLNSHEQASPYWTSSQLPASSSYQTSPAAVMGPPQGVEALNYPYPQSNQWAPPRSLSLSHIEQSTPQYSYHDPSQDSQQHGHPSQLPYPSPSTSSAHPRAATMGEHYPPSHPSYPYPHQQWQGFPAGQPYSQEQHPEYSGQWYAEPSAISRSEDAPAAAAPYGQPAAYYPNVPHPG